MREITVSMLAMKWPIEIYVKSPNYKTGDSLGVQRNSPRPFLHATDGGYNKILWVLHAFNHVFPDWILLINLSIFTKYRRVCAYMREMTVF